MSQPLAPAWRGVMIGIVVLTLGIAGAIRAYATNSGNRLAPPDDTAPRSLVLDSLDGGRLDAKDRLGRVVLVHFFATWCEPCRPELASLERLKRDTESRGIEILAVSVAEPEARLRRFFADAPVTFPVLLDRDRATARAWAVDAMPSTIVLDRRGTPRLAVRGDLDWQRPGVRAALDTLIADTDTKQTGGNRP